LPVIAPRPLIMTDVVLPRMNGRELSEHFSVIHPEARILFTSGHTRLYDPVDGGQFRPSVFSIGSPGKNCPSHSRPKHLTSLEQHG
jgi:DNA-binding NarL/FixJ family response regulator